MADISAWLAHQGLGKYARAFAEHEIDLDVLPHLTEADLEKIGLPMGPRKKLLAAIPTLQTLDDAPPEQEPAPAHAAERRQLTVLFCDLVGSTELSTRLDPEDVREVLRRYQDAVAGVVSRHDGYVANYLGDGVLAYFGWPKAHEDQAAQAVRAGLAAVQAVAGIEAVEGDPLAARVGIASGQVVIGDLEGQAGRQDGAVSGETPNLAARLQAMAGPGQVILGGQTRRLVGRQFELAALGERTVKGMAGRVPVWRVAGEAGFESRFEARDIDFAGFVGRDHELGLLYDRWQQARAGEGQAILLSGEAGIGKSRLLQELRRRVATEDSVVLGYQCEPHYANSAFHPIIRQLRHAAGFRPGESVAEQVEKLERLVDGEQTVAALLAGLLSLPFEDRYGPLALGSEARKQRTIQALIDQLRKLAGRRPVLFLFEDAHWIDPSTEELLGETVPCIADVPVLMVVTHRPRWQASWREQPQVTSIPMSRLGRAQAAAIVSSIAGPQVHDDTMARIVARTDGVPLFIEELTKALVERGLDAAEADIPATLQASLAARLDRLEPPSKEIAQIGAVIGREFDHDLLAAVADRDPAALDADLDRLLQSQLVLSVGSRVRPRYIFKHALVQDAAYESLLRNRRRELHGRIAGVLQESFPDIGQSNPEVLAHHCTEAGALEEAIDHWKQAGDLAAKRSAGEEAKAHLTRALELVGQLADPRVRAEKELVLRIALAPVLMLTEGFGSPHVREAYMRARELCRRVGDSTQLFMVTFGLWHVHQNRGDLKTAKEFAKEVDIVAREQENPAFMLQAHHAAWTTLFHLADQEACHHHTEQGRRLYHPGEHRSHKFTFGGHDPGVCARNHGALTSWLLGYPDHAVDLSREAIELATDLDHAMSLVLAHCFAAFLYQFLSEPEIVCERADAVLAKCIEQGIAPHYVATGRIMRGWATARLGQLEAGVSEMRRGLDDLAATEMNARRPHYLAMLSEVELLAARPQQCLDALSEAKQLVDSTGERRWAAEVYRLQGEALRAMDGTRADIEGSFRRAIAIASEQRVKSLELRAATSLADWWRHTGRRHEALSALQPVYNRFSEGFDAADLRSAKALLSDLA